MHPWLPRRVRDTVGAVARNLPPKGSEAYWEARLERLLRRERLCGCGCGEPIQVTLEWLRARGDQRNVWLPRFLPGHVPLISCACGCGELIEAVGDRGRPRKVVNQRHAARLATPPERVDWQKRAAEWNARAPECACGCGVRLHRTPAQMEARMPDARFLQGHGHRRASLQSLSSRERSIVLGLLLGDVSISIPHKTPRLAFTHGLVQKRYALHKMEVLERLGWWWQEAQTSGYTDNRGIRGSSSCTPALAEIYDLTRPDGGRKTVSQTWLEQLDDRSLAYWLMDDGSVVFDEGRVIQAALHTEGFTEAEHDLMVGWFRSRGYSQITKAKSKGYWYLYIPRPDAEQLVEAVRPFVHKSMEYKVGGANG